MLSFLLYKSHKAKLVDSYQSDYNYKTNVGLLVASARFVIFFVPWSRCVSFAFWSMQLAKGKRRAGWFSSGMKGGVGEIFF